MTIQELEQFCKEIHSEIMQLMMNKNSDYSGNSNNAFTNFELCDKMGGVDTAKGIYVRLSDKYARLSSFIKQGTLKVDDEKVQDTLKDMISYSMILLAFLKSKEK